MATKVPGEGGLEKVVLKNDKGETAEVYLHGAHVTSWKTAAGDEVLFTSKEAIFKPPKAIRGGVPVCFPQFADMGPIGQHGFARNSLFEVESSTAESVVMVLRPSEEQLSTYPHKFKLTIDISLLPGTLSQRMMVNNNGDTPMEFTCALHTYFGVGDISQAAVTGLGGTEYLDSLDSRIRKPWENDSVTFEEEVDRVYIKTKATLKIVDGANNRTVLHTKAGFPDAVVWNPWIAKAKATGDFGDEEYKNMLCVEPAIAASGPITVPAGQSWCGSQILVVE